MNPKVSIIIPNYNHAAFLRQRLDSVFNQTHQNFEVILLDDASTDNSLQIIEYYKNHEKVSHYIVNKVNSGSVFKQWIKGVKLAIGDYIWIAESDDFANINFLKETIAVLNEKKDSGMVFTDSIIVNENNIQTGIVSNNHFFEELKAQNYSINKFNLSTFLLKNLVILNASSVLFRKESLSKLDFQQLSDFKNTGDRFTYLSIAFVTNITFLDLPLNYMRLHKSNTTKINNKNGLIYKDRLNVLNYFLNDLLRLKINHKDLIIYLKKLYLPCIDCKYTNEIRKILLIYFKHGLLNFKQFTLLNAYSYLPRDILFVRKKIKRIIFKL